MTRHKYLIKRVKLVLLVALTSLLWSMHAYSSPGKYPLADITISQDKEALQRGFTVYNNTCRLCHSLKYIRYQHLVDIGLSKNDIDNLRGDAPVTQTFVKTMQDKIQIAMYGQVPPDLSVMAKARKNGPQYMYTLLTSYSEHDGKYENPLMPGIKMPDIMDYSTELDGKQKEVIRTKIEDVTSFLLWASDPHAAERKTMGIYVGIYFIILSILLYMVMKNVWSRLDKANT